MLNEEKKGRGALLHDDRLDLRGRCREGTDVVQEREGRRRMKRRSRCSRRATSDVACVESEGCNQITSIALLIVRPSDTLKNVKTKRQLPFGVSSATPTSAMAHIPVYRQALRSANSIPDNSDVCILRPTRMTRNDNHTQDDIRASSTALLQKTNMQTTNKTDPVLPL